ncbi:MAG TPA: hypothetical protein VFB99_03805, partial [Vicinamibacterales bacterium]|nr:hypothetical protein [Vicinamibacterales bacterium]
MRKLIHCAVIVPVAIAAMPAANSAGTIQFGDRSVDVVEGGARKQFVVLRSGDASGAATVVISVDTSVGTAVPGT